MKSLKRPNVLILYTDQQRWDSLGCNGNPLAKTPNIDLLAKRGCNFSNYYVQSPVCMPSRMSFLSGRYCGSLGVGANGISLPYDAVPVNKLLSPYGYHTAQIGKLHFNPHSNRNHKNPTGSFGFDTFILSDEPGCYDDAYIKWVEALNPEMVSKARCSVPDSAMRQGRPQFSNLPRGVTRPYLFEGDEDYTHSAFVAGETCRYIEQSDSNRPFFAIAGFYAPHPPVNPPKRFTELFDGVTFPMPIKGENEPLSPVFKEFSYGDYQTMFRYYYALVSHVDACVGQIVDALKRKGQFDDTVVIFTSDHGEYLGDHGRIHKGPPGHDCILRVPFIVSYPAKLVPKRVDALAEAVDAVPTVLDLCGVQTPDYVQGKSLVELLTGKKNEHKQDILMECFSSAAETRMATLRTKKYKYSISSDSPELVYDLETDPNESVNIVDCIDKTTLAELRKRLILRVFDAIGKGRPKEADY
jgi:arylsulfatase A-like enzyme